MTNRDDLPGDLASLGEQLEAARPLPTGAELDRIWQRATTGPSASPPATARRDSPVMRPRLAIISMLAAGIVLTAGGTGLAVTGISESGDAGSAQYGGGGDDDDGGNEAEMTVGEPVSEAEPQAPQQLASADDDSLPFTGFLAIPLVLLGIGLLAGGLILRRRPPPDQ